ncbi:hypothetical protein HOY80DRAFT_1136911 [Tuber brumale]|nr:hypothetical protein HOY80DRAFT_1136911 [Tuber brumale]
MLIVTNSPAGTQLSPFEKRDCTGGKGVNDSHGESPVAIMGLVVAALTLLVGIMSLRSSRFRRWVYYALPLHFIKVYLPLLALLRDISHVHSESHNPAQKVLGITLSNPSPTTITTTEGLRARPASGIPTPSPVFIYNSFSNARPACPHSNASPCGHIGITRGDSRAPQEEESLGPSRPEPVAACQFP